MLKKLSYFILIMFLTVSGAAIAGGFMALEETDKALPIDKNTAFVVKSGASLSSVLNELESKQWIRYSRLWRYYFQYQKMENIKKGEYQLQVGMTLPDLVRLLNKGKVVAHKLTLLEGETFKDYLNAVAKLKNIKHTLAGMDDNALKLALEINTDSLEGWFYPDTYFYSADDSDLDILKRAHQRMLEILEDEWNKKAKDLPYKTPYEALIMASIVEKETAHLPEQNQVAGVFVRRLNKGMRLQTDPTIIYGLGDAFDGNLTRKHLRTPNPYNSYLNAGLPPSPISNAGKAAIHAALHPDDSDSIYFVAKGDGTSYFSATLKEHNNAVAKFQRYQRSKNYQSVTK
jgi:UPF0755 protein